MVSAKTNIEPLDDRLRVLHLGSSTGMYGAERWILALIRYLPEDEVRSVVGVIKDQPLVDRAELLRHSAEFGFETVEFEAHGRANREAIVLIRDYIVQNSIDVVHTHGYKTDIVGALAVRGTDSIVVSTPHGWTVRADFKLRMYEWLDRLAFFRMDAVVPLSHELYSGLRWWLGWRGNLHLIRNGVDIGEVNESERLDGHDELQGSSESFVVGYIGRLVAGKGVADLLAAFNKLTLPGKRLWLVGEGPDRRDLERQASDLGIDESVTFFGYREDRLSILKSMNLFVLPSYSEGIPRCLLEAMAAGVPVLATDIQGCRSVVSQDRTGVLYPPGDVA